MTGDREIAAADPNRRIATVLDGSDIRVADLEWVVHRSDGGDETSVSDTPIGSYRAWLKNGIAFCIVPGTLDRMFARVPELSPDEGLVVARTIARDHFDATVSSCVVRAPISSSMPS